MASVTTAGYATALSLLWLNPIYDPVERRFEGKLENICS